MSLEEEPIILLEHTTKFFKIMHSADQCAGEFCTIHKRSDHSMRSFPQQWRGDKGIMERVCPHDIGHPDPDEYRAKASGLGVHGCDGCCG